MITLNDENIELLARKFFPVLRFHEEERFFPLLAESWLTIGTNGVWPEDPHRSVRLASRPDDPARRGSAVCRADSLMTSLEVLSGAPVSGDRPLDLDAAGGIPSLLTGAIAQLGSEGFLDVGGWTGSDSSPFAAGDLAYLTELCSELAAAVNPQLNWTPPDERSVVPWSWIGQPTNPTMYCEVTWGGAWPRRAQRTGAPEFPAGESGLDNTVAFTYHLLYGARNPGGTGRDSEGQWEAITLFFRGDISHETGEFANRGGVIEDQPFAVVVSQGQDRSTNSHFTDVRAFGQCERLGDRPVIYVTRGSHRNLFAPVTGDTWNPADHGPHAPDDSAHSNEPNTWDGIDALGVLAGIILVIGAIIVALLASVVGIVAAVVAAVIVVILLLILLIMWIASACAEADDEDAGEHVSPPQEPNEAGSDGPQSGGDGSEDPAPAGSGTSGGGTGSGSGGGGTVGLPNTGSPTGKATTFPDVRIVERLFADGAVANRTGFPAERPLENPTWWDYQGRWGVRVAPAPASGTWESGWQRVDELERDWGYFNAEALLVAIHAGSL